MHADVEQAMIEYAEAGYDCFEIPDFAGDEPLLVFYHPDLMGRDRVIDALEETVSIADVVVGEEIPLAGGNARLQAYDWFLQGEDASCIEVIVLYEGEWRTALQCIAARPSDAPAFSYADVFDRARIELEDNGVIG